jgi:hypothetical protein
MKDALIIPERASTDNGLSGERIYRFRTWEPLVGSVLVVHPPTGGPVSVELVSATEVGGRGECFSLVFHGPDRPLLEQYNYRVEHPALGEFPLFLVPIGPDAQGRQQLEAFVNRPELEP